MKARQLIKQLELAIKESGELDLEVVINTKSELTGRMEVFAIPLEQGEQEFYAVINVLYK